MKGAIVQRGGQPPSYGDFSDPEAQVGELRITVSAAALSPLTRARASGNHYSADGQFPFVAGVDGVGRLDDGRRVFFMFPRAPFGAMGACTVVSKDLCIHVPDDIDDATAAVIANPGMSSWAALQERARIKAGDTVLINGATGASGQLAVRIARHLGAGKVIATGRNDAALAALGADAKVSLNQPDDALEDAFHAHYVDGIDIILDYLWGPSANSLLTAAVRSGGNSDSIRFVQIGSSAGLEIALRAPVLRAVRIEMMGSGLGSVPLDRLLASVAGVFQASASAGLTLPRSLVPLAKVEAHWNDEGAARIVFTNDA